jgi:hypothetical protein
MTGDLIVVTVHEYAWLTARVAALETERDELRTRLALVLGVLDEPGLDEPHPTYVADCHH